MGFLDWFRRPRPASAALVESRPAQVVQPTVGVSGTANFSGRLQVERNAKLRDELAYGRSGSTEWGEWEDIRRTNPWVGSAVEFVLGPIQDARVDVATAATHPNQALAKAQADFVRWNLTEALTSFRYVVGRAADGMLTSGFSLFETPMALVHGRPETGGRSAFYFPSIEERLPNSLSANPWREDEAGNLVGVEQSAPRPGGQWFRGVIPADALLRFTRDQTGRNYAGFSAFRNVWYIAARLQPELLRLIGVTYQREGAGVPTAFTDDPKAELKADQLAKLQDLLANLVYHENASLVLPAGYKLEWVFSGGANKGHVLEAWKQLGVVVLQQVGAQQLALGTGDTGSRSVGQVHDARAMAYVRKVSADLESGFDTLVRRLVVANWGPQPAYPKLQLTLKRPELDPKTRVDALAVAKTSGLFTPTLADENYLREELGMSPISETERAAATPVPAPALPPFGMRASTHEAGCGCGACESKPLTAAVLPWTPWRALRASEKRTDWTAIDDFLATRRAVFETRVRPLVVEMLARAAPAITQAMADGNPSEVAELPLDTRRVEEATKAFLDEVRARGGALARRELRKDSGEELAEARRDVVTAAAEEEKREDEAAIVKEADDVLEAQQRALVRRMTSRLRTELEAESLDVLRTGGDAAEVVARVLTRQLETGAFRSDAGAVVTRIFNVGRDEAARIVGGVQTVERSAVLDSRVCLACQRMDGRRAQFGSAEHDALVPPERDCEGGGNCRCLLVFIPEGE